MQDLWADTILICRISWHRRWFWQKMALVPRPINCPGCIGSIVPGWRSRREPHRLTLLRQLTLRNTPMITKPSSSSESFWEWQLHMYLLHCLIQVQCCFSFLDTCLSSTIHWVISYLNSSNKCKNCILI